eukprot:3009684-Pleurochrysis_carterae.AAC.5
MLMSEQTLARACIITMYCVTLIYCATCELENQVHALARVQHAETLTGARRATAGNMNDYPTSHLTTCAATVAANFWHITHARRLQSAHSCLSFKRPAAPTPGMSWLMQLCL